MNARYYLLSCLALAACDVQEVPVEVNFAQPFPADASDLVGFLPRDCGQYAVPGHADRGMVITEKAVLRSFATLGTYSGAVLDSLGIPRRRGRSWARNGWCYEVQAAIADSFRVREESYDTLVSLPRQGAYKLRRYHGWYYFSSPATEDSAKWEVQRLGVAGGSVVHQFFNPDSLRILALDPAMVQRRHYKGRLLITLAPRSRQAISQVSSYSGLWLTAEEYMANILRQHQVKASQ